MSQLPWILSIGAFLIVTIIGTLLYAYKFVQTSRISWLQSEISWLETKITEASKDKKIAIANIVSKNQIRSSIDIKKLVLTLRDIASKHSVRLTWLSIQKDTITSQLTTVWSADKDAINAIIKMMRAKTLWGTVSLEPIYHVSGNNLKRITNVSFKILPNNPTENAKK